MTVISHLAPTPVEKHIISLDILRGFAVIGIFLVNIQIMNCHFVQRDLCDAGLAEPLDETVSMFIKILFVHKFLIIFSRPLHSDIRKAMGKPSLNYAQFYNKPLFSAVRDYLEENEYLRVVAL